MKNIFLYVFMVIVSTSAVFGQKLINHGDDDSQETVKKKTIESNAFEINDIHISLGVGFGSLFMNNLSFQFSSNETIRNTGPFYAKIENAVSDRLGFGVTVGYSNIRYNRDYINFINVGNQTIQVNDPEEVNLNLLAVLARLNWHYGSNKKLDPYMGVGMGYRNISYRYIKRSQFNTYDEFKNINQVPLGFEFTIGARFLFNESWGGFTEFGLAQSVGQFGLVYRIRN